VLAVLTFVVVRLAGSTIKTGGGLQSAAVAFAASLIHSPWRVLFYFIAPGKRGSGAAVRAALLERAGHRHRCSGRVSRCCAGSTPPWCRPKPPPWCADAVHAGDSPSRRRRDPELRPRTALGALVVVCALLVLTVRLYQLQILRGDEYSAPVGEQLPQVLFVPADRGMIKDRQARILVDNRPSFDVFLTPRSARARSATR